MKLSSSHSDDLKVRYRYFVIAISVFFIFILSRIWYLQIVRGDEFLQLAKNNRIRIRRVPASRGMILDRNGNILVDNRPSFQVSLVPEDIDDLNQVLPEMSRILHMDQKELRLRITRHNGRQPFYPVLIKSDISREQLAFLETHKMDLPGMVVDVIPRRSYSYNSLASHLVGYLGEIDQTELNEMKSSGYRQGDFIGKTGVEKQWESSLRGVDGGRQIEVDSVGREVRILSSVPPRPGNNVVLTIDLEVQKAVEDLLVGKIGAAVAIDPMSGRILAMASSPSFNPDLFASGICREDWITLLNTPFHPLQNKAIQGQYPPGSVFKIITAAAALEEGLLTPDETLECPGFFTLGRKTYRCWKKGGHGTVNLRRALVESCDVFFYQVALRLGIDTIAKYARQFGFGKPTGIRLGGEKPGLMPTTVWKQRKYHEAWYDGETLVSGIGQGAILVTPIQMANMISAIANGGILYRPQLVQRVEDVNGNVIEQYPSTVMSRVSVSKKTLQIIRQALRGVVEDPRGTGKAARIEGVPVFGKTGTAQVVKLETFEEMENEQDLPIRYRDHAWFVAYACRQNPSIAVAVLIQHGGHGASAAAPVARRIIEAVLHQDHPLHKRIALGERSSAESN
ncbi:MAG: penicillin-binding protein 2 [Deltaproteobacteria bacterium]|nr:penicillin-binding protein 2 [Deltaproteobacteria bacterium]